MITVKVYETVQTMKFYLTYILNECMMFLKL